MEDLVLRFNAMLFWIVWCVLGVLMAIYCACRWDKPPSPLWYIVIAAIWPIAFITDLVESYQNRYGK